LFESSVEHSHHEIPQTSHEEELSDGGYDSGSFDERVTSNHSMPKVAIAIQTQTDDLPMLITDDH
jgi:hypothetical protein